MSDRLMGARVLSFESRRHAEMATLIRKLGGAPLSAPSMQEVPLEEHPEAEAFARSLPTTTPLTVLLLTGSGARLVLRVVEKIHGCNGFSDAVAGLRFLCRGPKPVKTLKEFQLRPLAVAPSPNTWRELLQLVDEQRLAEGQRIIVQEYGEANFALLDALEQRGLQVQRLPVYGWKLPEDLTPLRSAIRQLCDSKVDAVVFTSAKQLEHLCQVATQEQKLEQVLVALREQVAIASVGPITTEALTRRGLPVHSCPQEPKMGQLIVQLATDWRRLHSQFGTNKERPPSKGR